MGDKRVPCLVYSRVVGYVTPVQNWNKGKRQEWRERKVYNWRAALRDFAYDDKENEV